MFDKPAPTTGTGDLINQQQHIGDLLVITVHEHITGMVTTATKPGETTEAVKADVYVVGPDSAISAEYHDTLLFGRVLVGQLKRSVGRTVLGILALGEKQGGKHAPYVLNEAPPAAEAAAVKAMTSKPAPAQEVPAQQQPAAAASGPWGAAEPVAAGAAPKAPWE